jgi:adenylate cyclase
MKNVGRTRVLTSAAIGAIAILLTLGAYATGVLQPLEDMSVDARFELRGAQGAPADVVVVGVDDASLDKLGAFPFPRCVHANVIDRVAAGNPSAIAIDIQFTEPSASLRCDNRLVESVEAAGNVVLGTTETTFDGGTRIFGGDDVLRRIGARAGITLFPTDDDGSIRRVHYELQNLKAFGVVAAELASGGEIARPSADKLWIDWAGPPGTVREYSYADVLDGEVPPSAFDGKLVVVGASAAALGDVHETGAGGGLMSGPEIEANVAGTALRGFPLRSVWTGWNVLLIVLFGLLAPLLRLRLAAWQSLVIALGAGAVFLVAAQLAFERGHVVLVSYPMLALALSCLGVLVAEVSFGYGLYRRSRQRNPRRTRILISAWIAAIAIGITLVAYLGGLMQSLELKTVDTRFDVRGSEGPPPNLAVVEIDDVTFDLLGLQWPYPRCLHSQVVRQIAKGKPSAIAIDIQFTEPTGELGGDGMSCDEKLINAVQDAGNVVLSTTEVGDNGETRIFGGDYVLKQIGARPGNTLIPTDTDGVVRHMPFETQKLKSFGVVAAEIASGETIEPPPSNSQWIDFAGPPQTVRSYSYVDVLRGDVPPSVFRNSLVVLGPSASSLQDTHSTATSGDTVMSGAELQANAAETALQGFELRSLWRGWNILFIVAFGLLAPLVSLRLKGWRAPAISVGVGVLFVVAAQLAFDAGRVVVVTYPLLALALSAVGVLVAEYLLEAFERVRTHDTFSRFVPETVVNQVLERTGGELRLGGELVEGTAMFTDLRGFTTFSEGLDAQEVIGLLNGYLGEISDAVLANGGTLVSYLGDGLMAVFGAPLPQDDHADRALAAAREMLEVRLPSYNETLRAQGFERGFKMGIGLNSGPFMSGNVGSERRLEYTAIGDTINTASRIEGMTKGTPYALYLADSTREALTRPVDDLVYIDEMPVRGRSHPIKLWSLTSDYVQKTDWESEGKSPPPAAEEPEASADPLPASPAT